MEWLDAPAYWWSRWLLTRSLGAVYLLAFISTVRQWTPLLGTDGLLPTPRFLGQTSMRQAPSVFHQHYSDRFALGLAWLGAALSASLVLGLPQQAPTWVSLLVWLTVWALYLSFVNVGQIFYAFGWESILLEAGFYAAFLGSEHEAVPILTILLFRWLLFRVEFGAGLIKLRGDACWRSLERPCLQWHHETQPLPNPLSWYFHRLPRAFHSAELIGNHIAQLVAPWLLFAPQPVASIGGVLVVVTQSWLVLSGNFSWLNAMTIVLAIPAIALPGTAPEVASVPSWFAAVVIAVTAATVVASWWPVRNMASKRQRMNTSFNPFHLVGSYGAFGSVTRERREIVIEGRSGDGAWRAYEWPGKPGDPARRPPQVAPYHLRLDWLLWFVPLSPAVHQRWLVPLLEKLLDADPGIRRLLRQDPFAGERPEAVRVRMYRYRFTTRAERRQTGHWWHREEEGTLIGPLTLADLR